MRCTVYGFNMFQDLRIGFRMLRRNPGFSILAILCLTVGIGATTAVFSWMEGILLRPFPAVAHQDRMVAMTGMDRNGRTDVSWPDLQDLRKNCTLVEAFIAEHIGGAPRHNPDPAGTTPVYAVAPHDLGTLGTPPL